jgi:hypothetical protein
LRRQGSWDAEAETGPEVGDLAAGGGEPGRGLACGVDSGVRRGGRNSESGPSRIFDGRQLPTHKRRSDLKAYGKLIALGANSRSSYSGSNSIGESYIVRHSQYCSIAVVSTKDVFTFFMKKFPTRSSPTHINYLKNAIILS